MQDCMSLQLSSLSEGERLQITQRQHEKKMPESITAAQASVTEAQ